MSALGLEVLEGASIPIMDNPLVMQRILHFLDQRDLCNIASVCTLWKVAAYDPSIWKEVDLPYPGAIPDKYSTDRQDESLEFARELKFYSTIRPPPDPEAFVNVLRSMSPSKSRFTNVTSVQFKNYMFSDETLELVAQLFPKLERLDLDGKKITPQGMENLRKFVNLRFLSIHCKQVTKINAAEWLKALEPTLERLVIYQGSVKRIDFLEFCKQCHCYYSSKKNTKRSCLYHPKEYSGYGHSCSSFHCCGSNTPRYLGTPGCTYGFHSKDAKPIHYQEQWLPELYDVPYTDALALRFFRGRRGDDSD